MKKFRSLSPETHGRGQQKVELNWRSPPNPMVSFFAVFLVTYLFNIFFRSLDSNIKKNMVEIEEFLIFFLLGYWTFDPIFTLVRYVKHWIEHHIYRRGNLDKFYVSEFIVGVIKIAIPTSKMESDVSTPNCLQCIPIQVVKRREMNHRCLKIHVGINIYEIFLLLFFFQN